LRSTGVALSSATQLHLYGLYKQATGGDAPQVPVLSIDMVARAKWAAWDRLRGTAAAKAMRDYVLAVDRELSATNVSTPKPQWPSSSREDSLAGLGDDSDDGLAGLGDADEADVMSAAVGTIGGPGSVSCMRAAAGEEEAPPHEGSGAHAALHAAARSGDLAECQSQLARGVPVDATDDEGHTALHWAADTGQLDVARLLLDAAADPGARNCDGSTALHMACASSQLELACLLLQHGADMGATDADGDTPLTFADGPISAMMAAHLAKAAEAVGVGDARH
jgi:acyl-CoA-binding protein